MGYKYAEINLYELEEFQKLEKIKQKYESRDHLYKRIKGKIVKSDYD